MFYTIYVLCIVTRCSTKMYCREKLLSYSARGRREIKVIVINGNMRYWHSQGGIWVFMQATPHTINDWFIANLFYRLIPAELDDALCDPVCLPPYFEPVSAHQLCDATDFKLGLATSFCESIPSGCALQICPTLLPIFLPVVCLQVSSNCTSLVEVWCSMSPSFPIF